MFRRLTTFFRVRLRSVQHRILRWRLTLAELFAKAPKQLTPRPETRRGHADVIINLFAEIIRRSGASSSDDVAEAAMDILRSDFPNVEHVWLREHFQQALDSPATAKAKIPLATIRRTEPERISLALEIFALLSRVGGRLSTPNLFEEVCYGLNLPGTAGIITSLVNTPGKDAPSPIECVAFNGGKKEFRVTLSPQDADFNFRVLRCVNFVIVVNDSKYPLTARGVRLLQGDLIPLTASQGIELNSGLLTYENICFLLQSRSSGLRVVNYLNEGHDGLYVTSRRTRNSIARVRRGLDVEVELLRREVNLRVEGTLLLPGQTCVISYYTPFTVHGEGPYEIADLYAGSEREKSFQLDPKIRKITVTNLPSVNRAGVLMLAPGLAPGVVFEVSFSRSSNAGTLRPVEGDSSSLMVEGVPVRGETPLQDGNLISLSAVQHLRCRFSAGVLDEESGAITTLRVRGLTRDFVRAGRVVDNIDFELKRGEMACILGPSGSGKSTLLNILAGHLSPSFGSVFYNSERLTPDNENLRRHIAFIPREDILDEAMTVGEHVYQASVARRPFLGHTDRMRRVLAVLNYVGISHLAGRHVGRRGERTISDGERTRLNLGLDLTGTAEVFLIDEPISGLASGDAERVIDTLSDMANGRILICTLHRPAASILSRFKKVMLLDAHGKMAFWGTPEELQAYFRKAAEEMNLNIPPAVEAAGGADYVFEVLESPFRKVSRNANPMLWQTRFERYAFGSRPSEETPPLPEELRNKPIPQLPRRTPAELWRLFRLWISRTFLSRVRGRLGLYAMLLEGPVLALLIAGTLRAASDTPYTFYKSLHITEFLFLSLVLAMFFGLTDAACEILRDRPLLRRESNYKLFISGYLLAKVLVLTLIAAVQCGLYLLVGHWILELEYMFWPHMLVMTLTAFVGISLSLMVSALVTSSRTAMNIVPLLLVPQILLAGALVQFHEMNEFSPKVPEELVPGFIEHAFTNLRHRVAYQDETTHDIKTKPVPLIAEFCPLRYAFEMLFVVQTTENRWDLENTRINNRRDELKDCNDGERIRFIQRTALLLNGSATRADEARSVLRRVRKAVLTEDERMVADLTRELEAREEDPNARPLEFFFSNKDLVTMQEGVKTARKDARLTEHRGFFLAPRQAPLFGSIDQETDEGSVSTIWRDAIYLLIMGLVPVLISAWRLRQIVRGR